MIPALLRVTFFLLVGLGQLAGEARAAQATVVPYPRVPGDRANPDILSVTVDGTAVETASTDMNVGYAHFTFTGTARVELTARQAITTFDISPHRYGVQAQARGNVLSFELSQPRKLHIVVNGLTRFFLFAEAPEDDPPQPGQPGVSSLTDHQVSSSPDAVQTAAIQRAIDLVAARKAVLYVPPGIYRCGQLRLKSDLTLYLAPGAILKGTGNIADYPRGELGTQQLDLLDCRNVRILGRGVVDGQGRALRLSTRNASNGRSKLIRSLRAADCSVEDVILRDSGTWGVHLVDSSHLRFTNCKLISNTRFDDPSFPWELNTDGFDPDNSSHIMIESNFISCNDDAIAVKLWYGVRKDMDDVQFRNNVVWTVKSALKIGSEVALGTLTNVVFANNEVVHADRGIVVYCYRGATIVNPQWINNHFEFVGGDMKRMNLEIKVQDEQGKGLLRDVLLRDNTFEHFSENPSRLQGLDSAHPIDSVTVQNLVIAGKRCLGPDDARIIISRHVNHVSFK